MVRIGEVSQRYDLSQDTLRFYERVGLIPPVHRDRSGYRDYSETDLRWVEFVKHMRGAGLSIDALKQYVGLVMQGDETIEARKSILEGQRELLVERMKVMRRTMLLLDYKIQIYEGAILKAEKELVQANEPV